MNIAGAALEVVYVIFLLVIVVGLTFSAKKREWLALRVMAKPGRILLVGVVLAIAHITLLFVLQEKNPRLYLWTFIYFFLPAFWLSKVCERPRNLSMLLLTSFLWICLELGWPAKNYVNLSSVALILIAVLVCWGRGPVFIKGTKSDWKIGGAIFGAIVLFSTLAVVTGWEKVSVTRYLDKYQYALPITATLFFFVKALPEELVFRGIFQDIFTDRLGFLASWLASSALFAASAINDPAWAFPNWHGFVNALVLGLACGYVFRKTESLIISGTLNAAVSFSWWLLFAYGGLR